MIQSFKAIVGLRKDKETSHACSGAFGASALYCYLEDRRHEHRQTGEKEDKDTSDSLFPEEERITKIQK